MRYLAIDYGLRRVGLAHCDGGETIVSPLCQLDNIPDRLGELLAKISKIIDEEQFEAVVVGLPIYMNGGEGEQAKQTRVFARKLAEVVSVPVHLQDERLSSAAADELLADSGLTAKKRKTRRDMLAACEILRDFLGQ